MRSVIFPFVAAMLMASAASAQLPEPPKNPPIFSAMTAIWEGQMDAPLPAPKGSVREVHWELARLLPGRTDMTLTPKRSIIATYDAQQHEVKRVDEDPSSQHKSVTTSVWENGRIQSRIYEGAPPASRAQAGTKQDRWDRWTYDPGGHVVEIQRGYGASLENHYLNFAYDSQGRVLRWDFRQGAEDKKSSRTEFKYSGNTVEKDVFIPDGREAGSQIQELDGANRVVDLKVSDLSKGELKLWYHTKFRYDEKGRVIEQDTDPYDFGEGADDAPMPGKFVAEYDDEKHSVDQRFYAEGKLAFHAIGRLDANGLLIELRKFDHTGKRQRARNLSSIRRPTKWRLDREALCGKLNMTITETGLNESAGLRPPMAARAYWSNT